MTALYVSLSVLPIIPVGSRARFRAQDHRADRRDEPRGRGALHGRPAREAGRTPERATTESGRAKNGSVYKGSDRRGHNGNPE